MAGNVLWSNYRKGRSLYEFWCGQYHFELPSQKSVNALVAVRRLSSLKAFTNVKSRPSVAPSLTTVPSEKEESCEGNTGDQITEECKNEQERKVDDQNGKHSQQNGESVVEGTCKLKRTNTKWGRALSSTIIGRSQGGFSFPFMSTL